jgi:hypothetical protein
MHGDHFVLATMLFEAPSMARQLPEESVSAIAAEPTSDGDRSAALSEVELP